MKNKEISQIENNTSPTKKEQEEVLNLLTTNAFDFLETGIREFDDKPKYSIIHFSTAIEMFLKARLMHHDWKLIFSNKDKVDWKKLKAGDFRSVNIGEAKEIIKTKEPSNKLINDACINFASLANHRNKIIHFYHHELDSNQTTKEKIISEYCNSWLSLRNLITNDWKNQFMKYKNKILSADSLMKFSRPYLKEKFTRVESEIKNRDPEQCPACGYKSLVYDPALLSKFGLGIRMCAVCDYQERILKSFDAHCQECGKSPLILRHDRWVCSQCKAPVDNIHKYKEYEEKIEENAYRYNYHDNFPEKIHCQTCDKIETVLRLPTGRDDITYRDTYLYLCTNCFEISQNCWSCEMCAERFLDDGRIRTLFGCPLCRESISFGYVDDD